ncbi:MAG: benzoate/H(+) symporter BenE family transporter, partial [Actinomycetota bacterium]|nr:benzoate/H(+) symporter BenE family transporter [Actinomycetota bacterium]
ITGLFDALMERVPNEVLMGALAGILLPFGIEVFALLPSQPLLVGSMVAAYLVGVGLVRVVPPALLALVAGFVVAWGSGRFEAGELDFTLSGPVFVPPSFDWGAVVSIAVPLTLLAVATQNAPGVGILRANGFRPPTNAITIFSGIGSILTAPLVGNGVNIAAPMTAVCAGPDSHPDPKGRYVATVTQGLLFAAFGLAGATVISLIGALPAAFVAGVAGLTLLPVILQALRFSVGGERHTLAAGVALLVGASGLSILGINSTFWALVVGVALAKVLGDKRGKKP